MIFHLLPGGPRLPAKAGSQIPARVAILPHDTLREANLTQAAAAFTAGQVERNAVARGGMDLAQEVARGALVLPVWRDQIAAVTGGGLLFHAPLALPAGAGLVYLGRTTALGDVIAADLGTDLEPPPLPEGAAWSELRQIMADLSPDEAELAATAKATASWHRSHGFCSACGQPSAPVEAGWQRLCPACGTAHFPRTDPVVIMLVTDGEDLLLGRSPAWPEGMYSVLAGFMEPGETIEAAVRREVAEETGIVVGAVRYLSSQPWPFPASLMLGCHGQALSREIVLDPAELADALWITRAEMAGVMAGLHPMIRPMRRGSIAQALVSNWLADRKS